MVNTFVYDCYSTAVIEWPVHLLLRYDNISSIGFDKLRFSNEYKKIKLSKNKCPKCSINNKCGRIRRTPIVRTTGRNHRGVHAGFGNKPTKDKVRVYGLL